MKVKITSGTYGHRPKGAVGVKAIPAGNTVDVSESEAARLVKAGVAVYVESMQGNGGNESSDTLTAYSAALLTLLEDAEDKEEALVFALELLEGAAESLGVELYPPAHDGGDNGKEQVNTPEAKSGEKDNALTTADPNDDGDDEEGIPTYNADMSLSALKEIMKDCGLTFTVGTSKVQIVEMLDEYFSSADDGEAPPALSTEEPVV